MKHYLKRLPSARILVIVDAQNDFITGSLAVPGAKEKMDKLCDYLKNNISEYRAIIVTKDWHPKNHCSFTENGGQWPAHCVQYTDGADIYAPLKEIIDEYDRTSTYNRIIFTFKGTYRNREEYSAFTEYIANKENGCRYIGDDNENYSDMVLAIENMIGIGGSFWVDIAGIAGDYCVKETLLDMMKCYPNLYYNLLPEYIASIDGGKEVEHLMKVLDTYNKCVQYGSIIHHFTDNDLYTFTCQYFALMNFPRAEIGYKFFDRDNTVYPPGFGMALQLQIDHMKDVHITEEEIEFMKSKIDFLPDWYYTFLRGFRYNPKEVTIRQDEDGHLDIDINGPWHSAIFWEMNILSCISELMHYLRGEQEEYDTEKEYEYAYKKAQKAISEGLYLADMGTRRRFSYDHHKTVVKALANANKAFATHSSGRITGTSNVYFAMLFDLTPIGTMSHQTISFIEGTMASPFEVNHVMMDMWSKTFDGNCGIYLNDCFTSETFLNSLSLRQAKLWDGIRIDSGDNYEETEKMIARWKELKIDPATKSVVYSNGLTIDGAIHLHHMFDKVVRDSYGIGTYLTCDLSYPVKPMNIVIKAVWGKITEKREKHHLVKISNDRGKSVGNAEKCTYLRQVIENRQKTEN